MKKNNQNIYKMKIHKRVIDVKKKITAEENSKNPAVIHPNKNNI